MALTAAEKMRRHRQKLKDQGQYEMYKEKHREDVKKYREKKKKELSKFKEDKINFIKLEEKRKTRERVAKYRALKKVSIQNLSPMVYKSARSLGKATNRARSALPKSPRKRNCVVRKLFETYVNNNLNTPCKNKNLKRRHSLALNSDTIELVKSFYERDYVSRQAPGLKDVTTVKENGKKLKFQTRHLFSSIRETHALFCSEFEDTKIGKTKFSELRPAYVKVCSKLPHNVCVCKYHENFIAAVNALHYATPDFPKFKEIFWNEFLCNPTAEDCWLGSCEICKNKLKCKSDAMLSENGPVPVKWFVWTEVDGLLQKVTREGTIEELIEYISSISDRFKEHVCKKRAVKKLSQ